MPNRKILSYDEEIDVYLNNVICSLQACGIKKPSKADALRFIIKQNEETKIRFKRKPKTKKGVLFL
jgi:hypothetical protein